MNIGFRTLFERTNRYPGSAHRKCLLLFLLVGGIGMFAPRALSKPNFPPIVESAYPLKSGGVVAKAAAACTLCHVAEGPPKLNPYGMDVRGALDAAGAKQVTPEILHSLDNKDSDGDGFTNGAEFAADTLPGDPTSKPAGTSAAAASGTKSAVDTVTKGGEQPAKSLVSTIVGLMFPKHAQHPVLVHFPIGAFMLSLLFDFLAIYKKNKALALAGYYNLTAAAITSLLAVATGLGAWWFAFGHAAFQGDLLYHLILALVTSALIWTLWAIRFRSQDKAGPLSTTYLVLGILAFVMISITGHLGGNLSGIN